MTTRPEYHRRMSDGEPLRPLPLRLAVLAYGWGAYFLFVKVMVYFVGFSGNFMVAKTVDSGPAGPWPAAAAIDTALLVLFFIPHSVMARQRFKDAVYARLPAPLERSTYVLIASVAMAIVIAAWRPIPGLWWETEGTSAAIVLRSISVAGFTLALAGSFSQGHRTLFGLAPAWRYLRGRAKEPPQLRTKWLYARLRHPMNLGFLIGVAVSPRMSSGHVLLTAAMAVYVAIGTRYEERDLLARHGLIYDAYRKSVPIVGVSARRR